MSNRICTCGHPQDLHTNDTCMLCSCSGFKFLFADITYSGDGWYSCFNWCGRDVRYRGVFCPHCSWDDAFYGITNGHGEIFDTDMDNFTEEMSQEYRGVPLDMSGI